MKKTLTFLLVILTLAVLLHTIIRVVRHFYKFPMPSFLAGMIDNPLRRMIQPPEGTTIRHGIQPGMRVLEVGPGNGTYTVAAARRLGDQGELVTIDIEAKIIQRLKVRLHTLAIKNVDVRIGDVYALQDENNTYDLVYMIAVIGEIPDPMRALMEFHRVLKPGGQLVFSELLMDPDYPLPSTLIELADAYGFQLFNRLGNLFYYTLIFKKNDE